MDYKKILEDIYKKVKSNKGVKISIIYSITR